MKIVSIKVGEVFSPMLTIDRRVGATTDGFSWSTSRTSLAWIIDSIMFCNWGHDAGS